MLFDIILKTNTNVLIIFNSYQVH